MTDDPLNWKNRLSQEILLPQPPLKLNAIYRTQARSFYLDDMQNILLRWRGSNEPDNNRAKI